MTFPARRPWWKKKRWRAAVILLASYPLSLIPVGYLAGLGFVPRPVEGLIETAYAPIMLLDGTPPGNAAEEMFRWAEWHGRRAASD